MLTWTVWDGSLVDADLDGGGTARARYLTGPAVDEMLGRVDASGATSWYLTDRTGSVRDFVDASGVVQDHIAYGSFGTVSGETAATLGDRFKYAGREYDAGSGLLNDRARYLQARTGRWTQEDPLGFGGGDPNLYRYVGNAPTDATDWK